jgi:Na+-translocating ferredoxin:NAD+ oxidoreductase subunit D
VNKIMWSVVAALLPTLLASLIFFGWNAVRLVGTSVGVCVLSEFIIRKLRRRDTTIRDGSAVITGMLLAFVVTPALPTWMMAVGAFLAIFLVKELFGGLGMNIFNPALTARAILLAAFPKYMTTWYAPFDAVTTATPLAIIKEHLPQAMPSIAALFLGSTPGSLGETSELAILVGGLFLIARKVIHWEVPLVNIITVYFLSLLCGREPLVEILSGGVFLGAFFMMTDMVTTPITCAGKIIFAFCAGVLTVLIRNFGGYPEGVCYSILIMNAFTPLIDRGLSSKTYGSAKRVQ